LDDLTLAMPWNAGTLKKSQRAEAKCVQR